MDGLTEGRIVHYVAASGKHCAAIVVNVDLDTDEPDLFVPPYGDSTVTAGSGVHFMVKHSAAAKPGTWHWIERVTPEAPAAPNPFARTETNV